MNIGKDGAVGKSAASCQSSYKNFSLALQALVALEKHAGKCSSGDLALYLQSEPTVLRRILKALAQENIIESREGRDGGYRLIRSADSISLADVYNALHIHSHISAGMLDAAGEHHFGERIKCAFSDVISDLEESMLQVLSARTIADIAEKTKSDQQED
ncbi:MULTISPECIES: Rrf2 family transcriptional regulator [unclassified Paenibacillus]|uniref:RrF2 family transcriptional regulator n=1 Tax=unclassified Paenibacillus TaxID=185978 RepID=UPI000BA62F31|nr:Rrf2 family transcriptional regulator [Paenibacillus sp. 7541]PAK55607.1 transcriptional regulator [Paenibacillus sp. 7541]